MSEQIAPFHHVKNVTVGRGRILYDDQGGIQGGRWVQPGWVLPGGRRTQDAEEAIQAASWIDQQSRKAMPDRLIG